MKILEVMGAYGRDAAIEDWNAGRDFRMRGLGTYLSIRDLEFLRRETLYDEIYFFNGSERNPVFAVKI